MRTHQLETTLRALKMSGMLETLEARLAQAGAGELGYVEFLQALCEDEVARRDAVGIARRVRAAHFEQICVLEDFDFSFNPKIPAARIRDLATLRFVDAGESVILHGPVGVGKTMIAQALGHHACRHGYNVTFTKASRLLADLAGGHADLAPSIGPTKNDSNRRSSDSGVFNACRVNHRQANPSVAIIQSRGAAWKIFANVNLAFSTPVWSESRAAYSRA